MKSELVTPTHLARKAVVYIRQSTPHQIVSNQESLRLQYALRQRARELGWHDGDIDVIDADLGLCGASAAQRSGFKELVGRVGLSEVGLILSIDVTRLARNCSDWYPLLDICGLRACLIADRDGVYDPGSANGRLLLGLKGTISELELHTIRSRLTAGLLQSRAWRACPYLAGRSCPRSERGGRQGSRHRGTRAARACVSDISEVSHRGQGNACAERTRPRSAALRSAWRSMLDPSDGRSGVDDPAKSRLRRRVCLWRDLLSRGAARSCSVGKSATADRGMADRRERSVSVLHRLADL